MVAVRRRMRRRSVPNLSPAVPNPKVVLRALVPNQKSTILKLGPLAGTSLRRARAASLKAKGSRFGALAEEEYDKIAPVIACTLPALTDSIPERKRRELAGEVTSDGVNYR